MNPLMDRYLEVVNDYLLLGDTAVDLPYDDPVANHAVGDLEPDDRFALVESSRYGQVWVTAWATAEAAANYRINQEYAEDWSIQELVNLATGERLRLAPAVEIDHFAEPRFATTEG